MKPRNWTDEILDLYRQIVEKLYPDRVAAWPVISGHNTKVGEFGSSKFVLFEHTGLRGIVQSCGIGAIPEGVIGFSEINDQNRETVREKLERHLNAKPTDVIVFLENSKLAKTELMAALRKHEAALGLAPMKIFLSHKGADKPLVREFKQTLQSLGFDPWLDEDAMQAGVELERGILKGFKDSCAAIFFITPNFKDEDFLASEVNYAIAQKRDKRDAFSIITIVHGQGGVVPELLRPYVWKEPKGDLEALREIVRALPVRVGNIYWR